MNEHQARELADTLGGEWHVTHTGGGIWVASLALSEDVNAYASVEDETDTDGSTYPVLIMSFETLDPDTLCAVSGVNMAPGFVADDADIRSRVRDTIEWYETGDTIPGNPLAVDGTY